MKKVLTIAVFADGAIKGDPLFDRLEILLPQEGECRAAFAARCAKTAKGKYVIATDKPFTFADAHNFFELTENATADILLFNGGAAYKTSVFKAIDFKLCEDAFCVNALSCLNSKSVQRTNLTPLIFKDGETVYDCETIEIVCGEFQRVKAKLCKEVYNYTFDYILKELLSFYIYAMIAARDGKFERQRLIEFDDKLKQTIVLYLAVEKKFPVSRLQKFRDKGFKISGFTARKLKKFM